VGKVPGSGRGKPGGSQKEEWKGWTAFMKMKEGNREKGMLGESSRGRSAVVVRGLKKGTGKWLELKAREIVGSRTPERKTEEAKPWKFENC